MQIRTENTFSFQINQFRLIWRVIYSIIKWTNTERCINGLKIDFYRVYLNWELPMESLSVKPDFASAHFR